MKRHAIAFILAGCPVLCAAPDASASLNILFFGNSYTLERTINNGSLYLPSVPDCITTLALAAGQPAPTTVNAAESAKSLSWHLANNTAVISNGLAPGQHWDYVVFQDQSTRPTTSHPDGNVQNHRQSAVGLFTNVALHSPNAIPVMYETWARDQDDSEFYNPTTGYFPGGPAQMQSELRDSYQLSAQDIDALVGSPRARIAPVGDAWEATGFDNLYISDNSHMNARGRMLSALVIYSTIYQDATHDLFLSGALNTMLASLNLSALDGDAMTLVADAITGLTPGLTGDLNADGFVGIADLNIVLGAWNQSVPPGSASADASGDGFIGIADLNIVLGNWNAGTPPGSDFSPSAPEPTTAIVFVVGGLAAMARHRTRGCIE